MKWGTITDYAWDFGDGTAAPSSKSPFTTHSYAMTGTYTVTLTVTGNDHIASAATTATIAAPPRAVIGPIALCAKYGRCFHFDGSLSSGGDGNEIVDYEWDLGDDSIRKGATVDHQYTKPGLYIVTLTITDSTGAKDSSSIVIKLP